MTRNAWYLTFMAAAALAATTGCRGGDENPIEIDASGDDAGMTVDAGMNVDSGDMAGTCGDPGRTGGLCRRGQCATSLECFQIPPNLTVREGFRIAQAQADNDENPTSFTPVATPVPANDLPINFAPGGLCTRQCNSSVSSDVCGECAECSGRIGHDSIGIPLGVFIAEENREFPFQDIGFCRAHCTFDPEGTGNCPTGHTCDPFTNLCVESCVTDAQCGTALVPMENGNYGTWRVPGTPTCNLTTGRCDWETPAEEPHVGDTCENSTECVADIGICFRGTCAETQCNNPALAPDTMSPGICDGARGVCIGAGGNDGAICIQGCNTANDCNPGNGCVPLRNPDGTQATIGTFTGYCFAVCDSVSNGANDQLVGCRDGEACDMPDATADDMDPDGTCRPTCMPGAEPSTCNEGQTCVQVEGQTHGFCRVLNNFCTRPGTDDCYLGRVCDGPIGASTFGRCVEPCASNDDCTTGAATTCVTDTEHRLAGLCVETCTPGADAGTGSDAGVGACGTGRRCEPVAGSETGYCTELPPPG